MSLFKAGDIYQFAIRIEEDGEKYYRKIAKKMKEKEVQELFNYLADEEVKHRKIFEEMVKKIEHFEPAESFPEEYFQYLRAYADNTIFAVDKLKREMDVVSDPVDAAEFGMRREQDSILYYQDIKNIVSKSQHDLIEKIIAEERKHFLKLVEIRKKYYEKA
jgi:rubrerythrin